jgi:hypothetical protein
MKDFVINVLLFLPFYLCYIMIGVNGYLNWVETNSQESYYRLAFGFILLISTFLATLNRIVLALIGQKIERLWTVKMILVVNSISLPSGFFICAYHYQNMFNFNDNMYRNGIIVTYTLAVLFIGYLSHSFWNLNRLISVLIGLILLFTVVFMSCLVFGYHYDDQNVIISGYIFMGSTVLLAVLLAGYLRCPRYREEYTQI